MTARFDHYAEDYDESLGKGLAVSGEDKHYFAKGRIEWLANRLANLHETPKSVLDFGCGTGTAIPYLLEILGAERAVGVDPSSKSLDVAARLYGSERVAFMPPENHTGPVDLAFCNGVFHHLSPLERPSAVQYVSRSLKPGGLFSFWENNPWNPGTRYVMNRCPFDRDAVTLTPPEARHLVRASGFEVLSTDFLFIFPRALRWFRGLEPPLSRMPFGAQYQILCRKPPGPL